MFAARRVVYMNHNDDQTDQTKKRTKRGPLRWEQSYRLLELVEKNPQICAEELQIEGASIGIEISVRTAFRFLQRYRLTNGDIFKYARTHLQIVTELLQKTLPGQPLSPLDIKQLALERGASLHLSTVYRILHKLVATGTIVQYDDGNRIHYEWKRERLPHGRITCVSCGQTIEFEKAYLNNLAESICSTFDYQHDRLEFTLHAHCRRCRPQ
jgi:Fe2+ or Zn2+ uptake regulation protein